MNLKNIKLVIWDLDDTFWKGTLSEGEIESNQKNIDAVKLLINKGIMNSICSKNDYEEVKNILKHKDKIWDIFVFPSIDWTPKGQRIKTIIQDMGLRAVNVLFIDDNINNLNEAKYYLTELNVLLTDNIEDLYQGIKELEDTESGAKRLNQYKVLEKKVKIRKGMSSNEEFLHQSDIRAVFDYNCIVDIKRISELVQRSNQLNFTKLRMNEDELRSLIDDDRYLCGSVSVRDRYGDYGLVGFFCLDKDSNKLLHFLFSCRTLGMGIEQYVYEKLKFPQLDVVGTVANNVVSEKKVDWIQEIENRNQKEKRNKKEDMCDILFKGPCDLEVILPYLKNNGRIHSEFNFINKQGVSITGFNHSSHIIESLELDNDQIKEILEDAPFLDEGDFKTDIFNKKYRIVFYSLLPDEHQGVYVHKQKGYKISFSSGNYSLTEKTNWNKFISGEYSNHNFHFTKEILEKFSDNYEFQGFLQSEDIVNNIRYIRSNMNQDTLLVLLLGCEVECEKDNRLSFRNHAKRHKEVNREVENEFYNLENVKIINFTKYVESQKDFGDCINHFSKQVYYKAAQDIASIINDYSDKDIKRYNKLQYYAQKIIKKIQKICKYQENER